MRLEFLLGNISELEAIALKYFRLNNLETHNKLEHGFDPVTRADREIEESLRTVIQANYPDDSITGEEFKSKLGTSGYNWVIDPIDGTRAFIAGSPSFAILCAIRHGEKFEGAVISQPFTQERFFAKDGHSFYQRDNIEAQIISTSSVKSLSNSILASTFPEIGTQEERSAFERVTPNVKLTRYGMDAYAYALLALGQIDLVIEAGLKPYDYMAPWGVVEGAGGVFVNWEGKPPSGVDRVVAAANQELADEALKLLNS